MIRSLFILIGLCRIILADGNTVLLHGPAGPFDITVLSKADVMRVGVNDLSVMVQSREGSGTVMNAVVLMHLTKSNGGDITRVTAIATHSKATTKTMYGATLNVPSMGVWRLAVDVSAGSTSGTAAQNINVGAPLPPIATYWPYVAMVPFALLAFVINRKLRRRFMKR